MDRAATDSSDDQLRDREPAWRRAAIGAVRHIGDAELPEDVRAALQLLAQAIKNGVEDLGGHSESGAAALEDQEAWPRLTAFAQVHGTVFPPGASSRSVVEEAMRYYQFEQQPPRVASRSSVLDRFGEQVGAIMSPGSKTE